MRRHAVIIAVLVQALSLRAAAQNSGPSVQHVPLHEAFTGAAELRFRVREPDRAGSIVVRCKPRTAGAPVQTVTAQRAETFYAARVPAACAKPPGFVYWAVQIDAGGEHALFASADEPHAVRVIDTPEREGEQRRLRASGYKRSHVLIAAEGVDFGDHRPAPGADVVHDRYYRVEAGYGYAFFERIEDIALTLVRVRGESGVPDSAQLASGSQPLDPGIDLGRASVTLLITDDVRTRASLLLGASQEGFEYGVSGELVLGDPLAEHLLIGGETITTLGTTGYLRLGFNATSSIPMGARVELTDFPLGRDAAVRLLYEVGYRFDRATELLLRAGYHGRTSAIGGPSLGLALRYGF